VREKQALGFYVSGHPLDRYGKDMSRFDVKPTAVLNTLKDWELVKIVGMVENYKEKIPKGGKGKIALFELEDLVGRVGVKAREKQLAEYNVVLTSGMPVLLTGKLSFPQQSEDQEQEGDAQPREPTLFLNEARLLSEAIVSETRAVTIRLLAGRVHKDQLASLAKVLRSCPGSCPVSVVVDLGTDEAVLSLPEMRVEPGDAMLAGLERVFGEKVADLH
jgi:DNA polymerase-3 subunit alpha